MQILYGVGQGAASVQAPEVKRLRTAHVQVVIDEPQELVIALEKAILAL